MWCGFCHFILWRYKELSLIILGLYNGNFEDGLMEGQGNYVWPDGTYYNGLFKENSISGYGAYEW